MPTFTLETLDLDALGQTNSDSIESAPEGTRWADIHVYVRRGWSEEGVWTISLNHSSSSSSDGLAVVEAFVKRLQTMIELARSLDTPEAKARMEANYQAARANARAEMERLRAEEQAKVDADPAMGEMTAADRVLDLIDAARATQGQTQVFWAQTRGTRRKVKFTAVRNHGTNMVFIKMAGQLTSKEKAIKALGAMHRDAPEMPQVLR